MKYKFYLGLFIMFMLFNIGIVKADICDSNDIARLKEIAKNVSVSYEYINNENEDVQEEKNEPSEEGTLTIVNTYNIEISNATDEIYLKDENGNEYHLSDSINGVISTTANAGTVKYYVYSSNCFNKLLRTITIELDKYNVYANYKECEGISSEELEICDKWYQGNLDYDTFMKKIEEYNTNQNSIKNNYMKYLYIVVSGTVLIILIVILVIRFKKRSVLE